MVVGASCATMGNPSLGPQADITWHSLLKISFQYLNQTGLMGWNYYSIFKLQQLLLWRLEWISNLIPHANAMEWRLSCTGPSISKIFAARYDYTKPFIQFIYCCSRSNEGKYLCRVFNSEGYFLNSKTSLVEVNKNPAHSQGIVMCYL